MNENSHLVQFFDGLHAEPFLVSLKIAHVDGTNVFELRYDSKDSGVLGSESSQKGVIAFDQLAQVEETHLGIRIQVKAKSSAHNSKSFLISDVELAQAFMSMWAEYKKSRAGVFHFLLALRGLKFWLTLVVGAVCVLVGLWWGIQKLHYITPISYDRYLGNQVHEGVFKKLPLCESESVNEFFHAAQLHLQKDSDLFEHQIYVVNDPMKNAFAIPGGNIYVFKGLLEDSESPEEVLGVLAHEMAHVEQRHSVQNLQKSTGTILLSSLVFGALFEGVEVLESAEIFSEIVTGVLVMNFSREFETHADEMAIERMHDAGLSVSGLKRFFERVSMDSTEEKSQKSSMLKYLSTHPTNSTRISRFETALSNEKFTKPKPAFLQNLDWDAVKKSCPTVEKVDWKKLILWGEQ